MNTTMANLKKKLELYEECVAYMRAHPAVGFKEVGYLFGMGHDTARTLHAEAKLPARRLGRPPNKWTTHP